MANTALQLFSIIFVIITIFLVYTARFFQARRKKSALRPLQLILLLFSRVPVTAARRAIIPISSPTQ